MVKDFEDFPKCEKCGFDRVTFQFYKYTFQNIYTNLPEREGEYIAVKCLRCGHEWGMKCAGNPPVERSIIPDDLLGIGV